MEIIYWVVAYLVLGVVVLYVTNRMTNNRLRNNLTPASYETQEKMLTQGQYLSQGSPMMIGAKTALILTVIALWIFWPAAIVGVIRSKRGDK